MDDKFKKDLIKILDEQFEKRFIRLFNQGFKEVVIPHVEDLKEDIQKIDQRMSNVERKLDVLSANSFKQQVRLADIESIPAIAHGLSLKKST